MKKIISAAIVFTIMLSVFGCVETQKENAESIHLQTADTAEPSSDISEPLIDTSVDTVVNDASFETEYTILPTVEYSPYEREFVPLTDPSIPCEEDLINALYHASEIYNLLSISSLDAIPDASLAIMHNDMPYYYPVKDYETVDAFRTRLLESFTADFSENIISRMLSSTYYEYNGRLYVTPSDRGTDIRIGKTWVEYETVDSTTVNVTRWLRINDFIGDDYMTYPVGLSPQEMPLVYEDGRWVFDNFYVWDNAYAYDSKNGVHYDFADDIAKAFATAKSLAAHFTGYVSAYDGVSTIEVADESGTLHRYDSYPIASSLDELREMLEKSFTPELCDKFIAKAVRSMPLFLERNGVLYKYGGFVAGNSVEWMYESIDAWQENENGSIGMTLRCSADMGTGDNYRRVTFTLSYTAVCTEDGVWRFEHSFPYPEEQAFAALCAVE